MPEDVARRRSVRLARMSPSLTLTEVAAAAGAPIQQKLAELTPRGVCGALAAAAATGSDGGVETCGVPALDAPIGDGPEPGVDYSSVASTQCA